MARDCASLWRGIASRGKRAFMATPDRSWSHTDLQQAIGQWIGLFDEAGLASGHFFVICCDDEFLVSSGFLAGMLHGRVPVLLTGDTPKPRLQSVLRAVDAGLLLHDGAQPLAGIAAGVHQLCLQASAPSPVRKGLFGGFGKRDAKVLPALPAAPAGFAPDLPADRDGLAYVLFTSGTTSAPTGVQVTRGNLFANLATLIRLFGYDENSRIFNDMGLAHADGMDGAGASACCRQRRLRRAIWRFRVVAA